MPKLCEAWATESLGFCGVEGTERTDGTDAEVY